MMKLTALSGTLYEAAYVPPGPHKNISPADSDAMRSIATAEAFSIRSTQGRALKRSAESFEGTRTAAKP